MRPAATFSFVLLAFAAACSPNEGEPPPPGELNFPVAVVLSPPDPGVGGASRFLYVGNSNFDLRYSGGSITAFDLDRYEDERLRLEGNPNAEFIEPATVSVGQVVVGSQLSAMVLSPDSTRLYAAIRGNATLTYVEASSMTGQLSCGGDTSEGIERCSATHEIGGDAISNERRVTFPREPTGVVAGRLGDLAPGLVGDYIVAGHRQGAASLFLSQSDGAGSVPTLVHVLDGLNPGIVNARLSEAQIAWMPTTDVAADRRDNFIVRVGIAIDPVTPQRSFLYDSGAAILAGLNDGEDKRDVVFSTRPDGSHWAYVLSRRPEALVVVDLDASTPSRLFVQSLVSVGFGPSRMELAEIPITGSTETRTVVFVTCFDSGDVYAVAPETGRVLTVVRELSGPFELEVDPVRGRLYVSDFRSSVVRVVDLTRLSDCLAGTVAVATTRTCEPLQLLPIGRPRPVRELL